MRLFTKCQLHACRPAGWNKQLLLTNNNVITNGSLMHRCCCTRISCCCPGPLVFNFHFSLRKILVQGWLLLDYASLHLAGTRYKALIFFYGESLKTSNCLQSLYQMERAVYRKDSEKLNEKGSYDCWTKTYKSSPSFASGNYNKTSFGNNGSTGFSSSSSCCSDSSGYSSWGSSGSSWGSMNSFEK